jgi:predicted nuclease with TOPRIM domain
MLQAEMDRLKDENKTLKEFIDRTIKDYHELQNKLDEIKHQEEHLKVSVTHINFLFLISTHFFIIIRT